MSTKLTPWFPSDVLPVHKGYYIASMSKQTFYRYWDGKDWHYGAHRLDLAIGRGAKWPWKRYPLQWRGLATKPTAKEVA